MTRSTWVWCKARNQLVPKGEEINNSPKSAAILKPIDPFVSPVDGRVISDRGQLRKHNKEHGVTDFRDYGHDYFVKRGKERRDESQGTNKKARMERKEALNRELKKRNL